MAHFCETCGRDFTNPRCPRCGGPPQSENIELEEHGPEPVVLNPAVSDPDATLDTMASRPTLASLLKRGVESGLITPSQEYSAGNVR
jgi:hypothetical protein